MEELLKQTRDLNLPKGKFVLFGSAPMGVRGIRECDDIDIIVTDDVWLEYERKGDWAKETITSGSKCLRNGRIEIVKNWSPGEWDTEKLIKEAEIIDGLPFVRLDSVIEWKKMNAREKDIKDVELIQKFLRDSQNPHDVFLGLN